MIRMFKLTSDLGIAPGRGRWPIVPEIVEEVTVVMTENAGCNVRSSSSEEFIDTREEQQHYCCFEKQKTFYE